MANPWEYESSAAYYARKKAVWEAEARQAAFNASARNELATRGYDPDLFYMKPSLLERPRDMMGSIVAKQDEGTGGLLGAFLGGVGSVVEESPVGQVTKSVTSPILKGIDKTTSFVFRGKVRQPWDVFRPLVQAFDWEQANVGKNLYRGAVAAAVTPAIMVAQGELNPAQAFMSGLEKTNRLPPLLTEVGSIAFSPSSWVGTGLFKAAGKIAIGGGVTLRDSRMLAPLLSRVGADSWLYRGAPGLLTSGPGAKLQEPVALTKLLERANKVDPELVRLSTNEEVLHYADLHRSVTQQIRRYIGSTPLRATIERLNPNFFDTDIGIVYLESRRLPQMGASFAAENVDSIAHARDVAFVTEGPTKLIAMPDVNRLTRAQQSVLKDYRDLGQLQEGLKDAFTVKYNKYRPVRRKVAVGEKIPFADFLESQGIYTHRQPLKVPVGVRDSRALELQFLEEQVAGPAIPAVKARLGAKQSFQKMRTIATQAEGELAGIEYLPFDQAQQAHIMQTFQSMGDSYFKAATSDISRTASELLALQAPELRYLKAGLRPIGSTSKFEGATDKLVSALSYLQSFKRFATRTTKGMVFKPTSTVAEAFPDLADFTSRINELAELPAAQRRTGLRQAASEISDLIKPVRAEVRVLKSRRTTLLKSIREGSTTVPEFPVNVLYMNRFYPQDIGQRVLEYTQPAVASGLVKKITEFNNSIRPVMATADASFLGIQGLLGLARNPVAYAQAAWMATVHPESYYEFMRVSGETGYLKEFLKMGGYIASRHDVGEFMLPSFLKKAPGVGVIVEGANAWFTRFGNTMRLKLYEAGRPLALSKGGEGELRDLATFAGKATGYVSGKPTEVEKLATFAPRFFRSQFGLIADALTKGSIGGAEARRTLTQFITLGAVLTYGANKAMGNPTDFNPTSSNFMRIRALGLDISVFGPWDTLVKGVIASAINPQEGVAYMARAKASPALARLWDVFAGETWIGQKIDFSTPENAIKSMATLVSESGPIGVQQALEKGVPTSPEMIAGSALQLAGTKATPLTANERLQQSRDQLASQYFNKSWRDLAPADRVLLQERFTDKLTKPDATTEVGKAFQQRREIGDRYKQMAAELDAAIPPGPDWREAYQQLQQRKAGEYMQWEARYPELAGGIGRDPRDPQEKALTDYYQAFKDSTTSWGALDPEVLSRNLDTLEGSWSPGQATYVERNTGLSASKTTQEYRAAQKTLRDYWGIQDLVWDKMRKVSTYSKYESLDEYLAAKSDELKRMGLTDPQIQDRLQGLPIVKEVTRAIAELRVRYRRVHPDVDAALVKWYGATPITQQSGGGRGPASQFAPKPATAESFVSSYGGR